MPESGYWSISTAVTMQLECILEVLRCDRIFMCIIFLKPLPQPRGGYLRGFNCWLKAVWSTPPMNDLADARGTPTADHDLNMGQLHSDIREDWWQAWPCWIARRGQLRGDIAVGNRRLSPWGILLCRALCDMKIPFWKSEVSIVAQGVFRHLITSYSRWFTETSDLCHRACYVNIKGWIWLSGEGAGILYEIKSKEKHLKSLSLIWIYVLSSYGPICEAEFF